VRVHTVAQVELDSERHAPGDEPAKGAEHEPQRGRDQDRAGERPQVGVALADAVDGLADHERDEHARAHGEAGEDKRPDDADPIWAQKTE
jgi:hypothetical protein